MCDFNFFWLEVKQGSFNGANYWIGIRYGLLAYRDAAIGAEF